MLNEPNRSKRTRRCLQESDPLTTNTISPFLFTQSTFSILPCYTERKGRKHNCITRLFCLSFRVISVSSLFLCSLKEKYPTNHDPIQNKFLNCTGFLSCQSHESNQSQVHKLCKTTISIRGHENLTSMQQ